MRAVKQNPAVLVLYNGHKMVVVVVVVVVVFSASCVQHVSDLHYKFALRPHGSMADIQSVTAEIRRGKKER